MEPLSAFYKGPLLVLDFQSLYPSVMIAYNYCYSCVFSASVSAGKSIELMSGPETAHFSVGSMRSKERPSLACRRTSINRQACFIFSKITSIVSYINQFTRARFS